MSMDHFVGYHNADKRGAYIVYQGTFETKKPYRSETLIGNRIWVIEGNGSPKQYELVSTGIITKFSKNPNGNQIQFQVEESRDGIEVTNFDWFKELLRQQQSFRNGFSRIGNPEVIQSLERNWQTRGATTPEKRRSATSTIEDEVRALIPQTYLLDIIGMLARSIQIAHNFAPAKWGIRINKNSIMLKVGFPEVFQVGDGWVHYLVSNKLIPAKTRRDKRFEFSPTPYKNAPECDTCDIEIGDSKSSYSVLLPAYEAAIEIAARSQIHTTTPSSHSPELVDLISRITETSLPQPTYVEASEKIFLYPDEQDAGEKFLEGTATRVLVNRYERDPAARKKCVAHHGAVCKACGISFGDRYGPSVKGFIHVHHLVPLGDVRKQKAVDPIRDLQPVCPNCHAVIHSTKPPLSVEQVRSLIKKHRKLIAS